VQTLNASSFELASCQATVFTPDGGLSVSKIMTKFYSQHAGVFDGSPIVLPVPQEAPLEIPRIILESTSHEWRCELSPASASITWRRTKATQTPVELVVFFQKAADILLQYSDVLSARVGRVAGLATRFCEHETPALFLARHFCKNRWDEAPLNRPENFELHAHKKFLLAGEFQVNSWARNKTGLLAGETAQKPIVLFEQDINTLAEAVAEKSFQHQEIRRFLAAVATEADVVLRFYFPET